MELSFERRTGLAPRRPLADALELGAWRGAWTITIGALPAAVAYFVRYSWMSLPWGQLAAQLGSFVAIAGAIYGAGMSFGEAVAREARVPRLARPLCAMACPALAGALSGALPGAYAAERFGRMTAPYFGTMEILVVAVLAFFLFGAVQLRGEGVPALRAVPALGLSLVAPLAFALSLASAVPESAWLLDGVVLSAADGAPSLALFGAGFGASIGLVFGGLLGLARTLLTRYQPTRARHPRFSIDRTTPAAPGTPR
ncbi:MAG: hypothetical protein M5U28_52970 [Sandaracinaceae bacterium]|nr:hypothetical protein [Sandaracinaceae bacterium]